MGHFGRTADTPGLAVRWSSPACMLSYLGQGALVLRDHADVAEQPVLPAGRRTGPAGRWCVLATAATVIASQAVISGAFSVTRQAVHQWPLRCFCVRLRWAQQCVEHLLFCRCSRWFLRLKASGLYARRTFPSVPQPHDQSRAGPQVFRWRELSTLRSRSRVQCDSSRQRRSGWHQRRQLVLFRRVSRPGLRSSVSPPPYQQRWTLCGFRSEGTNLVPEVTNAGWNLYRRDLVLQTTEVTTLHPGGVPVLDLPKAGSCAAPTHAMSPSTRVRITSWRA